MRLQVRRGSIAIAATIRLTNLLGALNFASMIARFRVLDFDYDADGSNL